jgi:hypothetical protein
VGKPGSEPLTREEELVVRMSRGLGEGGSFALPMRSGSVGDLRARLALIEAGLLAEVHGAGPLAEQLGVQVDADMKAKILARLSQLDD